MYVSVSDTAIGLVDPEDTKSFKVVTTAPDELDSRLRGAGWGALDGEEALISIDAVRRAAAGRVAADWASRFDDMLAYASAKGWLSPDGTSIRAHLEHNV